MLAQNTPAAEYQFDLTEIIGPAPQAAPTLLMPMLAQLSRQSGERWFTWITERMPSRTEVLAQGFDPARTRIFAHENESTRLWLLWESLANGTSAFVAADLDTLGEVSIKQLRKACQLGQCRGIVFRPR